MKRQGSKFPLETERNRSLLKSFRELFPLCDSLDLSFYQRIADSPTERFWVTEERATLVVLAILKGAHLSNMLGTKAEMYEEIYHRYLELRKQRPGQPVSLLVGEIVNQPAPRFYMAAKSVREIIYRLKRKCYEETKKRLRHQLG